MNRSQNEIVGMLHKASIGAGFPVGLAEDISRAGAWLCAKGYDGVGAVLSSINNGMVKPVNPMRDGASLLFPNAKVAVCGPSVLDLLASEDATESVRLNNADSPLLFLGLAGVWLKESAMEVTITFSDAVEANVSNAGLVISGNIDDAGNDLLISCTHSPEPSVANHSEQGPVFVNETLWHHAEALAAKTYVPSSAASHTKGAGAGLVDND